MRAQVALFEFAFKHAVPVRTERMAVAKPVTSQLLAEHDCNLRAWGVQGLRFELLSLRHCRPRHDITPHRSSTAPARSMIMRAPLKRAIWSPMAQYIYTMNRVSKIVPPKRVILRDISLSFFPGAKIGVLGLNGSGKSTLLKIMSGLDKEIEGEARAQTGIKVGYLPQEPLLDEAKTVRQVVGEGVGDVQGLIDRFNAISDRFSEPM